MPHNFSIPVAESILAITAATNKGLVTVSSNTTLYPGAYAWITKSDGSGTPLRVLIVKRVGTTQVQVRQVYSGTEYTIPAPSYGFTDVSAFNTGSSICQEAQTAPVVASNEPRQF
jgi:hypothetical protein